MDDLHVVAVTKLPTVEDETVDAGGAGGGTVEADAAEQ